MKKEEARGFIAGVAATVMVICLVTTAGATNGKVKQELEYRNIGVTLNGTTLSLKDANGNPVEPFMFNGTNYLPVRALADTLGMGVSWDGTKNNVVLTTSESNDDVTDNFMYRVAKLSDNVHQLCLSASIEMESKKITNVQNNYNLTQEYINELNNLIHIVNGGTLSYTNPGNIVFLLKAQMTHAQDAMMDYTKYSISIQSGTPDSTPYSDFYTQSKDETADWSIILTQYADPYFGISN